jgi:MFS family permease
MPASRVRYWVLLLTFLTSFIMYMDRACVGSAQPTIMREFGLDKIAMGWSTSAFNWAYALFQIPGGWMADRFGARLVLGGAMAWWSAFTAATGMAFNGASLAAARFLFGMGEAAAFPSSSRALVRWLPVRQRAFGQGFQHAGSRLGAAVTPPLVVYLIVRVGWHWVFYLFGMLGVVWAVAWYVYYRNYPQDHPGVNQEELEILRETGFTAKPGGARVVPWRRILTCGNLWLLSGMYFCYGWVLWIYILWLPTYLVEARHFTQLKMGWAASTPLLAATLTNVLGGWASDRLAHRWSDLRRGRLFVSMFGFVVAGIALVPGVLASDATAGLLCLTLALAGLELTVAVSWAICIDIGGDFSGSVSSVMNTWGNVGGAISAVVIGYLATKLGWNWPFLVASAMCITAAFVATRIDPSKSAVG